MVKQNSTKAWLLASRPKTLTAASIPVMLGCALAFIVRTLPINSCHTMFSLCFPNADRC